ncbi:GGDEF domain-containing protein [Planctomycetota bacterium]
MKKHLYLFFLVPGMLLCATGILSLMGALPSPPLVRGTSLEPYLPLGLIVLGFIGLTVGLYFVLARIQSLQSRIRQMAGEIAGLNSQNTFYLQQMPLMRSNIESLSTMREISRAINIHVEFEKILEEVLRIISQMTGAAVLDIFLANIAKDGNRFPLKAHFASRGQHGYCFLYFDTDPEDLAGETIELGDFRQYSNENFTVIDTAMVQGGLVVGTGKVFAHSGAADMNNQQLFLKQKIASFEIDQKDIARVIEVKNIIRVQSGRTLQFAAPLIAEQKVLGVIKMSIEQLPSGLDPDGVENMLRESSKHISLAIKKADLYEKAVKDGMTNLYNKPHFLSQLDIAIALAQANAKRFCLLMFDIDHFKNVNDTYGHLAGDVILIGVANILRRHCREHDMAFRYGGEELAIILDETGIRKAAKVANRIRTTVREKTFIGTNGEKINITISIGISQFYPDVMRNAEELISRADQALYEAKENGRDQAVNAPKPRKTMSSESGSSPKPEA